MEKGGEECTRSRGGGCISVFNKTWVDSIPLYLWFSDAVRDVGRTVLSSATSKFTMDVVSEPSLKVFGGCHS